MRLLVQLSIISLTALPYLSTAQTIGSVTSYTKISDTQGNFTGTLIDGDRFTNPHNIGDLNNDGVDDMAIGNASNDDGGTDRGAVWILFMNANGTVNSHQKISDTQGNFTGVLDDLDYFGSGVSPIGDLNNDGVLDIAVGAYYDDDGGNNTGAVWILFLNTDGTVNSHQKICATTGGVVGLTTNRNFGSTVANLGDLDGDGIEDIAVGSPAFDDLGGLYRGCVWILFMNSNGTVSSQQRINDYEGGFSYALDDEDRFGYRVSTIGDIDGDGVVDIASTAIYDDDGGSNRGAVYILFLNTDGTVKADTKISDTEGGFGGTYENEALGGLFSTGLGDIDADGVPDMAISMHRDDDGGADRGAIYILLLNTDGTVKSYEKISDTQGGFTGTLDDGDNFGHGVTNMGDLNGDGNIEIAVGALYDDDGGTDRGAVYVLNIESTSVGIDELDEYANITVSPNPTDGVIAISGINNTHQLRVYNAVGQAMRVELISNKIDMSHLSDGMYNVEVSDEDGSLIANKKVIKY